MVVQVGHHGLVGFPAHSAARSSVELSGTSFLDSVGVAVLFDYAGHGLDLVLIPDSVTLVLDVTSLTKAARVRYSTGAALDDRQ